MSALLSVVVPVYGTEAYLKKCIDSLISQSLRDIEIVLVNDCTPDRSQAIMEEYARRDSRIKIVVHEENKGLFQARISGADAAGGKYIAFLDSDDYVSIDFYRLAVNRAEEGGFDIVMGDTVFVDANGMETVRPVHSECTVADEYCGGAVREAFFSQEASCYSWHTVWNKVYRKDLWDRCAPWFRKMERPVIMTEDIAFSSLLFYHAQGFARIHAPSVFYCTHATSSTGASRSSVEKTLKNYRDIVAVFEFVDRFLEEMKDDSARSCLMKARERYCRMWYGSAMNVCGASAKAAKEVRELSERLAPGCDGKEQKDTFWFERSALIWDGTLEKIKRRIREPQVEIVSFDIFDTLALRPFAKPTDLFELLQRDFNEIFGRSMISFTQLRRQSEEAARQACQGREDVTLDEIYAAMAAGYRLDGERCREMAERERQAEIKYIQPRRTGVELMEFAVACGKRVVLISDMYLDRRTIEAMLDKCGAKGWDRLYLSSEVGKLKWTGNLFRHALEELRTEPEHVMHIGDNLKTDVDSAVGAGMTACCHPAPMSVYADVGRSQISRLGRMPLASFASPDRMDGSLAARCMQAMIANRHYDMGFPSQHPGTMFSGSPALMGYGAVGPHLLAVADWMIRQIRERGYRYVAFLARDGYLYKQAVEYLLPEDMRGTVRLDYLAASRKLLMPALTKNRIDFYSLPLNRPGYTPEKLFRLLDFCSNGNEKAFRERAKAQGVGWEERFSSDRLLQACVTEFLDVCYDEEKHKAELALLEEYYAPLRDEQAVCFDMGYSGRLQAAISEVCGRPVPVFYIHEDGADSCSRLKEIYGFPVHCFYETAPGMSGAFREFLLSADEPGATGLERREGRIELIRGEPEYNRAAHFVISVIQHHAMEFLKDWQRIFGGEGCMAIPHHLFSMPFESMLRYMTPVDIDLFSGCVFDDTVFAGEDQLDLAGLIRVQAAQANQGLGQTAGPEGMAPGGRYVSYDPERTGLIRRTIGYLLFDQERFVNAARNRLSDHPQLRRVAKKIYRMAVKPKDN